MKHALEGLGRPCPLDEVLASFIGPSLRVAFATLVETSDTKLIGAALALYRERLSATGLYENEVYPSRHFTQVYGSELDGRFDDKTELIAHVHASEEIDASAAVMIGDRAGDVLGARANAVRSVGVLWGYGSERELVEAGADRLCAAPAQLEACF